MLAVIAILASTFAGLIGLKYLINLIAACIIYQAAYRDEPVVSSPDRDRVFSASRGGGAWAPSLFRR
jgi:hypothetical protein